MERKRQPVLFHFLGQNRKVLPLLLAKASLTRVVQQWWHNPGGMGRCGPPIEALPYGIPLPEVATSAMGGP